MGRGGLGRPSPRHHNPTGSPEPASRGLQCVLDPKCVPCCKVTGPGARPEALCSHPKSNDLYPWSQGCWLLWEQLHSKRSAADCVRDQETPAGQKNKVKKALRPNKHALLHNDLPKHNGVEHTQQWLRVLAIAMCPTPRRGYHTATEVWHFHPCRAVEHD